MKIILILLDGLGDRACESLKHLTPLAAASTPNLDQLARVGCNGLFHASLSGQCLPSETAHFLLFGCDLKDFPGRGLLEAVGEQVPFGDKDVLCLAHLSGVEWKTDFPVLVRGRDQVAGSKTEIGELFNLLTPYEVSGLRIDLHQTRRNDGILILRGQVSPFISDSDPILIGKPVAKIVPLSENPEPGRASKTADALNRYLTHCHRVLTHKERTGGAEKRTLPAGNFLVTQRAGRRIVQVPLQKRWGLAGMLIASGSVYKGLALELGLTFVQAEDSGDPGKDLQSRIRLALEDPTHDFIHVHTKVPDEAAHTKDPMKKKEAIELLDGGLTGLLSALQEREDLLVAVTADHSTPSSSVLIHSGEPVPLLVAGPSVRRDTVTGFDETQAAAGSLGFLRGKELMLTLLNYSDRSSLLGHCIGEEMKPYYPLDYTPFRLTE